MHKCRLFRLPYLVNYCILNVRAERESDRKREMTSIGSGGEALPDQLILIICWQLTTLLLMNSSNYLPGEHSTLIIHTLTHSRTHAHTLRSPALRCTDILPYYVYATYGRLPKLIARRARE